MRHDPAATSVRGAAVAAPARPPALRPPAAAPAATFAEVEEERVLRRALLAACVAHLALLAVSLSPQPRPAVEPPRERAVFRVEPVRVRQPPPPPVEPPPVQGIRVPIPDPTPDDPEPVRDPLEELSWSPPELPEEVFSVPPAPPPLAEEGPLPVGGDVLPPVKVHAPPPLYPEAARRVGLHGIVVVEAVVDAAGAVRDVRVLRGPPILDRAAAEAVSGWRFAPATRGGQPVAVRYNLTVTFTLAR